MSGRILPCLRALALVFLLVMPAASSAMAGEAETAGDPSVQLAPITIPVIVNGQVINYLFLSIRVNLTAKADESKLRDQEPYFRDALIRTAYKTSFAQAAHADQLDTPRFKAAMMVVFARIAGAGMVKSIDVLSQGSRHRNP